jgi:predicted signal transduction protein with EAL and GGDEF domain
VCTVTNTLPRILCVDDEPEVLAGLRRTLRRTYDVTIALGGRAAIEEINSRGPFTVIVSDLNMPQMNGIDFLRWVSEHAPDTAGILLTGNANLSAAIAAVNTGYIFRFLTKPCPLPQLLDAIAAGCNRHAAKYAERILLNQAVDQDAVTGLPDRRRFATDVARLREREPGMALTLIVIAIDDLELVKRTLGHAAADSAIVASARRLQAAMREPRLQLRHAVLFRIDDRLALLWCERANSPADLVAAHLLKVLRANIVLAGQNVRLSGHVGIAILDAVPVGSSAASGPLLMLRNAEAACLEASAASGSRIAYFSASADAREQRRLRLLQGLRSPQFVANLSCVFQPQWALQGNRLIGLEALARWQDPELGAVSPAEFVPLAEEDSDVANRLADWMLVSACQQRCAWRSLISDEVRVAVNFSATQLRAGNLHERIRSALADTGLRPALFEVEITESAAIADFASATAQLVELRRQGVGVAIDDFGVGYSSLSYLAELPATCLKIDRAFVQGIEDRHRRLDLLRGICSLGHAMHMSVIVEGVESLDIAVWLRTIGCDAVQGFAISRPLLAAAFPDWYKRESPSVAAALVDAENSHPESRVTA